MSVSTERKLVTVLFCDLVGSTALGELLDPEALQSVQHAYFGRMRAVIEQFGGTVEKFKGDAVVAVFGVPTLHEDDAERAVRCALEMQQALLGLTDTLRPRFGVELAIRIGVQTGEAVVSDGTDALATGDVMNTAARLEQRASPGQILVGADAVSLTEGVVEYGDEIGVEAKGKAELVRTRPALRLHPHRRRARSPVVGRESELETLAAALERAIAECEVQTVVVVGEPGIGKTRLAEEFTTRARGRATVLAGACLPYGEGSTWRLFEEVIRADAGIGDRDDQAHALGKLRQTLEFRHSPNELPLVVAQLAPLAGASSAAIGSVRELRWSLRRYLEGLGSVGPAVLFLDDMHWADETLLEAVREVVQTVAAVPLVVVLQGRPELSARLKELPGNERSRVIALGGLSPHESTRLVGSLSAALGTQWADDVMAAIVERGNGSPLFLEEIAAMARDQGLQEGVPQSLRALIGARLDLLPDDAKRLAQVAAVLGDVFSEEAVAELAGAESVSAAIEQLSSRGLIDGSGPRQFAFHHALIREVAYLSVTKTERSDMHRRAAASLGRGAGRRPDDVLAVAHHLERALSLRREVFPAEAPPQDLVDATVDALRSAAAWSAANASVHESVELLRRAIALVDGDRDLTQLASAQLATMFARSGRSADAAELARSVLAGAEPSEAAALASLALAEDARSRGDKSVMTIAGTRALELSRLLDLPLVEVDALDIIGLAESWSGRIGAAVERRQRAIEIARNLGDKSRVAWALAGYNAIGLLGLGELEDAERQAAEAMHLATETGSLRALESAHTALACVRRTQDRLDEAVAHGRERLRLAEQLGERLWLFNALTVTLVGPLIELGRLDEAWQNCERALEIAGDAGGALASSARANRIAVLLAQDRLCEAQVEADHVDWLSEPYIEIAGLRAAEGRNAEARAIWQRLLDEMMDSEDRLGRAEILVGYARFLARCGGSDDARARLAEAQALVQGIGAAFYERKIREVEATLPG